LHAPKISIVYFSYKMTSKCKKPARFSVIFHFLTDSGQKPPEVCNLNDGDFVQILGLKLKMKGVGSVSAKIGSMVGGKIGEDRQG